MLDRTKPVQTRDGRKVTIYTWDAPGDFPIHGRIEGNDHPCAWPSTGRLSFEYFRHKDLVNVPNKIKVDGWINIYSPSADFPLQGIFLDKDKAVQHGVSAIARKHISFEIEEGQFDK